MEHQFCAWLCQRMDKISLLMTCFLNEDYPGWLHEVNLGATTVWERWNSLEEDGSIQRNRYEQLKTIMHMEALQNGYTDTCVV